MKLCLKILLPLSTLLLLACYFIIQSEWIYRSVLIPELEQSLGLSISASKLKIIPWKLIALEGVKVNDPSGKVGEIKNLHLHYKLLPILDKQIVINELTLEGADLNLFKILKSSSEEGSKKSDGTLYPDLGYDIQIEKLVVKNSLLNFAENEAESKLKIKNISLSNFHSHTGGDLDFALTLSQNKNSAFNRDIEGRLKSKLSLTTKRNSLGLNLDLELSTVETKDEALPSYKAHFIGKLFFDNSLKYTGSTDIKVSNNNNILADLSHKGEIDYIDHKTTINGDISSNNIKLDSLIELFTNKKNESEESRNQETTSQIIEANLNVKLTALSYKELSFTNTTCALHFSDNLLKGDNFLTNINSAPLKGSFIISTLEPGFRPTIDLDVRNLSLKPVVKSISEEAAKNLSGEIKRLTFKIENSWAESDKGLKERDGDLRATFKNLKIPAYYHDIPPINLLFIPVDALSYVVDKVGSAVLPDSIVKASTIIDEENQSGQIEFHEAQIKGLINGKGMTLEDTKFNSYVLPTFTFDGRIDFDESLDLTIGVEVLKIPIPLPVTGSLSLPLPDLVGFPLATVKSLGLGIGNIAGVFDSEEAKEEEFFGDK